MNTVKWDNVVDSNICYARYVNKGKNTRNVKFFGIDQQNAASLIDQFQKNRGKIPFLKIEYHTGDGIVPKSRFDYSDQPYVRVTFTYEQWENLIKVSNA